MEKSRRKIVQNLWEPWLLLHLEVRSGVGMGLFFVFLFAQIHYNEWVFL